jgi:transposase InsO family protein
MELRREFVSLALQEGSNVSQLCRRFEISRKTAYKWLGRSRVEGEGFEDRSRRPLESPTRTAAALEARIVSLRGEHPAWGGRKLRRRLREMGEESLPVVSTMTAILRRNGCLDASEAVKHKAFIRFEHPRPNGLWQMDFKGHVEMRTGGRCHPLTVLDDHSRYALCIAACANERTQTVQDRLIETFRRYGLPERMTMDNGSPWGDGPDNPYTPLTVWLMRLGVRCGHSRPYHPQTQGKNERMHRSLKAEAMQEMREDLASWQAVFDAWRVVYNTQRPHQALDDAVPAQRYQPSPRSWPNRLPEPEYGPDDFVRHVQQHGRVSFKGHEVRLPNPTSPIGAFSDDTTQGNQRLDREGLHYREVCAGSVAAAIFGGGWGGKASFMRSRSSRSSGSGSV